jgi:hypothetical protein
MNSVADDMNLETSAKDDAIPTFTHCLGRSRVLFTEAAQTIYQRFAIDRRILQHLRVVRSHDRTRNTNHL